MNKLSKATLVIAMTGFCSPVFAAQDAPAADAAAASPAAPAAGAAPAQVSPAQLVDRDFGAYDLDKSGSLDATEFSSWVVKLRKPAAAGAAQTDSQNWSAQLFARADADHNQLVSKAEMTTLLASARG